ncbi:hypothetical protein ACHAWF_015779 [Thalassiosira exigua]
MVFPTKRRRRSAAEDGATKDPAPAPREPGSHRASTSASTSAVAAGAGAGAGAGAARRPPRTQRSRPPSEAKLVVLTAEQASDLSFPVGCPVWYDFSFAGEGGAPLAGCREGTVASVRLDLASKSLSFEVRRKLERNEVDAAASTDSVAEDDVSYAAGCPVVVSSKGPEAEDVDGEILFAKPSNHRGGTRYAVKHFSGSARDVTIEEGVTPDRLRYRAPPEDRNAGEGGGAHVPAHGPGKNVVPDEDPSEDLAEAGGTPGVGGNVRAPPREDLREVLRNDGRTRRDGRGRGERRGRGGGGGDAVPIAREGLREGGPVRRSLQRTVSGEARTDSDSSAPGAAGDGREVPKRRAESSPNAAASRMQWEPPHSWRENDGAI